MKELLDSLNKLAETFSNCVLFKATDPSILEGHIDCVEKSTKEIIRRIPVEYAHDLVTKIENVTRLVV